MGDFINAEEVKVRTEEDKLICMDPDVMEERYILVAERAIEDSLRLNLNTDLEPRHFSGLFTSKPHLETEFRRDYKNAVVVVLERLVDNPLSYRSQSVKGGSTIYDRDLVPMEARMLMRRWSRPRRVGRG